MAEENFSIAENANGDKRRISLDVCLPGGDELIACEVCGHKNPKSTGICEMCSNYLFDGKIKDKN